MPFSMPRSAPLYASLYTSVCLSVSLSMPHASLTEVWSFRLDLDKQSSFGKPTTIGPVGNYVHIPHAAISKLRKHEHVSVRMILQRRHPSKANLEGKTVSDVTSVSMLSSAAAEIAGASPVLSAAVFSMCCLQGYSSLTVLSAVPVAVLCRHCHCTLAM